MCSVQACLPAAPLISAAIRATAIEAREALRALAGLRWRRRRVLALRLAGYGYKEIAERLGVTYTNVNRHISEGSAELRRLRDAA
jgi:DNA-directed RNA polymerase specialized sigma24 family protein